MSSLFKYGLLLEEVEHIPTSINFSAIINSQIVTPNIILKQELGIVDIFYRTGATAEACEAAAYIEYSEEFMSAGFVQTRIRW